MLAFQNKYELDHIPYSFVDYLSGGENVEKEILTTLQKATAEEGHSGALYALYRRLENIFVVPFSADSERTDWTQLTNFDFDYVSEKLKRFLAFANESLNIGYIIFDTQAGPGSLSLAAATLSDLTIIILEEDDISWRTALNLLLEISELNKRLQRRARSYFLANKAGVELIDAAGKLRAFSFLPPLPYDAGMQRLFARATAAVLEKEFENTDFFRQAKTRVWQEIAGIFGVAKSPAKEGLGLGSWFRKQPARPKNPGNGTLATHAERPTPPSVEKPPAAGEAPAAASPDSMK